MKLPDPKVALHRYARTRSRYAEPARFKLRRPATRTIYTVRVAPVLFEASETPVSGRLAVADMRDLMREYERARYPADRRLDVQAEGPQTARERVLKWIQSRAHEEPGGDLLLIVSRGTRPGAPPTKVEAEVRDLLANLEGRLIEWWQPFAPGSLAVRLATKPSVLRAVRDKAPDPGEGRTAETAGIARPLPSRDIPPDLFDTVQRVAELRIEREGLSSRVLDVVLREVWNEAQVRAMEDRLTFAGALDAALEVELADRFDA